MYIWSRLYCKRTACSKILPYAILAITNKLSTSISASLNAFRIFFGTEKLSTQILINMKVHKAVYEPLSASVAWSFWALRLYSLFLYIVLDFRGPATKRLFVKAKCSLLKSSRSVSHKRCFSGSQVLCSSDQPSHLTRYSIFPPFRYCILGCDVFRVRR